MSLGRIHPSKKEFIERAGHYKCVPVYKQVLLDTLTPVACLYALDGDRQSSFLCESVAGNEEFGRYSFIGVAPRAVVSQSGHEIKPQIRGDFFAMPESTDSILGFLKRVLSFYQPFDTSDEVIRSLPFVGGAVGYCGFETEFDFRTSIVDEKESDAGPPDALFMLTDLVVVFDHLKHMVTVISSPTIRGSAEKSYQEAVERIEELLDQLKAPARVAELAPREAVPYHTLDRGPFAGTLKTAQRRIERQLVSTLYLASGEATEQNCDLLTVYRFLRTILPCDLMYFFRCNGISLAGASPDLFFRHQGDSVTLRECALPRTHGIPEGYRLDTAAAQQLAKGYWNRHLHMVAAAHGDLQSLCLPGSIRPRMEMAAHPQAVSGKQAGDELFPPLETVVEGRLKPGLDGFNVFQTLFPPRPLTGVPRSQALESIRRLEKRKRGPFCGVFGCFSFDHSYEGCLVVDSIGAWNGNLHLFGGAPVAAETPLDLAESAAQEILTSLRTAIDRARQGEATLTAG